MIDIYSELDNQILQLDTIKADPVCFLGNTGSKDTEEITVLHITDNDSIEEMMTVIDMINYNSHIMIKGVDSITKSINYEVEIISFSRNLIVLHAIDRRMY